MVCKRAEKSGKALHFLRKLHKVKHISKKKNKKVLPEFMQNGVLSPRSGSWRIGKCGEHTGKTAYLNRTFQQKTAVNPTNILKSMSVLWVKCCIVMPFE